MSAVITNDRARYFPIGELLVESIVQFHSRLLANRGGHRVGRNQERSRTMQIPSGTGGAGGAGGVPAGGGGTGLVPVMKQKASLLAQACGSH
jgi:hypothetical protein